MESYMDLDLHVQFVCFFLQQMLIGLMIKVCFTNFQTNGKPLLLNVVTDINHMDSVFLQCKLQQSKVRSKMITESTQY